VAAIIAAVSGFTALAIGGNSDNAQARRDYAPALPLGMATAQVFTDQDGRQPDVAGLGAAIAAAAPNTDPLPFGAMDEQQVVPVGLTECGCTTNYYLRFAPLVGGADLVSRLTGRPADPVWARALAAGDAIVLDDRMVQDGQIRLTVAGHTVRLRALVVTQSYPLTALPAPALVSPATAARLGVPAPVGGYSLDARNLDAAAEQRLRDALQRALPDSVSMYVERGYQTDFTPVLLVLGGIALVLVLGGALIATGLAAADARPDLATMAAVGAAPRLRRLISMSQAGVVALLGTVIGTLAGLVPGIAITWPLTANGGSWGSTYGVPPHGAIIDIPWLMLGAIGLGVPLLAMLVVGGCTRGRLPLTRRLAG
jgi:putative ABC transport system permease protein